MEKIKNKHDRYFRESMRDLRVAKSFLEAHLPEKILACVEWKSLRLEPSQHINKHLSEFVTDVLYSVTFKKETGYIMVLVEHQSTRDPKMPFRVLDYSVNIMRHYANQNPGKAFPLVVPLVFYAGRFPYNHSTDVFTLFGDLESLAREVFLKPFQLIDVGQIPDEKLREHTWAGVFELVQKHAWKKDFSLFIRLIAPLLRDMLNQAGDDYVYTTLKYMCEASDLDDSKEFAKIVKREVIDTGLEKKIMTLANMLRKEGHVEGRQEGRQEGREEGERLAKEKIAREMISEGVELNFVAKITGLTIQELEKFSS